MTVSRPALALALALATALAGAALAHSGVQNPAVLERMDGMKASADALKTLGGMARGEIAHDVGAAEAARAALVAEMESVPHLFEAPETDPASEARPVIWDRWGEFVSLADEATREAAGLDVSSPEAIGAGLRRVGAACSACHDDYRLKN